MSKFYHPSQEFLDVIARYGLQQYEVARKAGTADNFISRIGNGLHPSRLRASSAWRIANAVADLSGDDRETIFNKLFVPHTDQSPKASPVFA